MSDEKEAIAQNISLLLAQNRSAEARVELDRLMALDPEDPESRSLAGDVYAWTEAHGAAYKQYNLAADTFNRLGRADKALGVHHKILDLDTSMMDAATQARIRLLTLLVGAEDALVAGQNDKAVAGYKEAIRQFPNHTITYQRLGSLLVRMGRNAEAVEQYLTVGRAFYAHGVLAKARPYFERVLELQPDQSEALDAVLACLKAEDKEGEGQRFLKAAVQGALEHGRNEEAAAWFERLPDAGQDATPLGAALLLQSGEVGQAERMVAQLDLAKPEIADWFKRLGRAALDRGDSLSGDVYFRWGSGQLEPVAPVASLPPMAPPPPLPGTPVQEAAAPAPEPEPAPVEVAMAEPLVPPPGLAAPTPPPPSADSGQAPSAGSGQAPSAGSGQVSPASEPMLAAASSLPSQPPPIETQEDRAILQTMGEMCLAEEMFEEAKQVFDRLLRADPSRAVYWELLNRARAGLGLSPVAIPALAPMAPPPMLVPPVPVALVPAAPPAPEPAPVAPPVLAAPLLEAPTLAPLAPSSLAPPVLAPLAPPALTLPPSASSGQAPLAPQPFAPPALSFPSLPPLPLVVAAEPSPLPLFAAAEAQAPSGPAEKTADTSGQVSVVEPTVPTPEAAPVAELSAPEEAAAEAPSSDSPVRVSVAQPVMEAYVPEAGDGRPQLEPMGRRSHSPARPESGIERPTVEWGDSPFAVGPDSKAEAHSMESSGQVPSASSGQAPSASSGQAPEPAPLPEPLIPPPVLVPPPSASSGQALVAPPPLVRAAAPRPPRAEVRREEKVAALASAPGGPARIVQTHFTVQLGELPPAVLSAVDLQDDDIIE